MSINPLTKVQFDPPPSLQRAEEFIPETQVFEVPSGVDYMELTDRIVKGLQEDINQFQFIKRLAMTNRATVEIKDLTNISAKRVIALKTLHDLVKAKQEFLAKHKVRVQSEGVVRKAIDFLLKEIKTISMDYGTKEFFNFVCKELDSRLPKLDEMIESEVDSKFQEQK